MCGGLIALVGRVSWQWEERVLDGIDPPTPSAQLACGTNVPKSTHVLQAGKPWPATTFTHLDAVTLGRCPAVILCGQASMDVDLPPRPRTS